VGRRPGHRGRGRERIADDLAYTTVLTILRTLEQKGYLSHAEDGRAHRYKPLVKREVAGRTALRRLVDKVFDGSPELLLTQLVPTRISVTRSCAGCASCWRIGSGEEAMIAAWMLYCCAIALLFVVVARGSNERSTWRVAPPLGLGGGHRRLVRRAGGGVAAAGCIRRAAGSGGAVRRRRIDRFTGRG